jgi:hypothetical protein
LQNRPVVRVGVQKRSVVIGDKKVACFNLTLSCGGKIKKQQNEKYTYKKGHYRGYITMKLHVDELVN